MTVIIGGPITNFYGFGQLAVEVNKPVVKGKLKRGLIP